MSTTDREPERPANETETPREAHDCSRYAVTIAALEAALAERLPVDGGAAALSTVDG